MGQVTDYLEIRDRLSCLDMLVCDHKRLFWRYVGHTASVYVGDTGQVQTLESTQMSYSGVSGVQIHPMGEWLDHYPGRVSVRQLLYKGRPYRESLDAVAACAMQARQEKFIRKFLRTSYPNIRTRSGRWKLILARLDFELFGKDLLVYLGNDAGIFCTQLKVEELQFCHVVNDDLFAAEAEPRNTRTGGIGWKIDEYMIEPWSFGPEIPIK